MISTPYKVYLVVDRDFDEKSTQIPVGTGVWMSDTINNRLAAERIRGTGHRGESHLTGISMFTMRRDASPEDDLISIMQQVEIHHGRWSADPPYTELEVIGTPLTDRIKAVLSQYGFNEFHTTASGFRSGRALSAALSV